MLKTVGISRRDPKSEVGRTLNIIKMFKPSFKSKLIFAVMVIFGITAFMSCEKEESIDSQEKQSIEEYNKIILEAFKVDFDQLNCLKSASYDLTEVLKTDEGKALFIGHFSNLKIEIEGKEYAINDYDPLLVDELYESTLEKLTQFDSANLKSAQLSKAAPTKEEIRAALKEECGKYMFGIDAICKLAVDIAYILS